MKNEIEQKLKTFAENNNWQMPHPLDMDRFYEFVIEAYNDGGAEITRDEFLEVVNPIYKLSEDELDKWLIKYENGIELLKIYNKNR